MYMYGCCQGVFSTPPVRLFMATSAYYDADSEGIVYWVKPESLFEDTYDPEVDSDSGESFNSSDTLMSCEIADYFHEINGRVFINNPNAPIWHAVDEHRRLDLQHKLLKVVYGGNYFGPVAEVLQARPGHKPRVLDICTRNGVWVQEMAQQFPHAHFLSLDIAPIVDHVPRANVTFEVYDISTGILEGDETFDFVRIAHITEIIKDVPGILKEAQRLLKPGGLLFVVESETALYESHDTDQPSLDSTPLTWKAIDTLHRVLAEQGVEVNSCRLVAEWLSPESHLWENYEPRLFVPFENIKSGTQIVHAGGWDADIRLQEVRLLLAQYGTVCWRNLAAAIATLGLCEHDVRVLVEGAVRELKDPCTSYAVKFHHVFARKGPAPE
ncbi:unnamed protein product [Rhizoctonia solani]|uniref:Methyltransferase domain-containing protein n=1 Tax=Rhizoctonia solani TaxID=456999 RepID=A0A8H3HCX7_9AGAM|nr:unnamed protein product [Rhizoctonia solani]